MVRQRLVPFFAGNTESWVIRARWYFIYHLRIRFHWTDGGIWNSQNQNVDVLSANCIVLDHLIWTSCQTICAHHDIFSTQLFCFIKGCMGLWDIIGLTQKAEEGHTKADSHTRANHLYKYRQKPANTTELQNLFTHRTIAE